MSYAITRAATYVQALALLETFAARQRCECGQPATYTSSDDRGLNGVGLHCDEHRDRTPMGFAFPKSIDPVELPQAKTVRTLRGIVRAFEANL